MSFQVHTVVVDVGALDGGVKPVFKAPSDAHGGGISILEAELCGVGTVTVKLVDAGTDGAGNAGTLGTLAGTLVANTPQAMTISSPFLDAGHYLGVSEESGAFWGNQNNVSIKYVMGK